MTTPGSSRRRPTPAPRYRRLLDRDEVDALVTSFPVPRELHGRLKVAAARLNWSLAEVLRTAAAEWLDRTGADSERSPR
jgi:hypothetical protein